MFSGDVEVFQHFTPAASLTAGLATETPPQFDASSPPMGSVTLASHAVNSESSSPPTPEWFESVEVGYDNGFVISSSEERDLVVDDERFRLRINGWAQLRHTLKDVAGGNRDLNQLQLKRGRLVFSGRAFRPEVAFFMQIDGRSSTGEGLRLLDAYASVDLGRMLFDFEPDTFGLRLGKYKMPFHLSRWLSGRQLQFTDRSIASIFFDINRSYGLGLFGTPPVADGRLKWEVAILNGFNTGGAATGTGGTLDDNFAFSGRLFLFPTGRWGTGQLSDFGDHDEVATRMGLGVAFSEIDRLGTAEFNSARVVDSGQRLSALLPPTVAGYQVFLIAVDASLKYRGFSATAEVYHRSIGDFGQPIPRLDDNGLWLQAGLFVVPDTLELIARWSSITGNSGTLGLREQSAREVGVGAVWYMNRQHAKLTFDVIQLDGAPINASVLDIAPGDRGWLARTQLQLAF